MVDIRLKAIADLIMKNNDGDSNRVVCDVGTDHAYLPCYLVKSGIAERCIACDINEKPLAQARNHVVAYGVQDKIDLVLSDGLKSIPASMSNTITDIVIAGMGGELIASIITGVEYTKNPRMRLVLQPMTNAPFLREFLYSHGFFIEQERAVIDKHHHYTVMLVRYNGECAVVDDVFKLVGRLANQNTPESQRYIKHEYDRLTKIANGLKEAKTLTDELQRVEALCYEIKRLIC